MRALIAMLLAACATPVGVTIRAEPWPAAEAMFQRDPRWLGGDACYSVDLGGDRILWLFGDSFVGLDGTRDRRRSVMVRNTIAIQQGRDPLTAQLTFHWGSAAEGKPAPFFANDGEHGFWPLHGVRLREGPLCLFQTIVRNTPGQGLGFAIDGWRIVCIDNPDDPPSAWSCRPLRLPTLPFRCMMGTAVWLAGDHVHALGTSGDAPHPGYLCRLSVSDLLAGWIEPDWCQGVDTPPHHWPTERFGGERPVVTMTDAAPECSLQRGPAGWLHVCSRGFGATTIAVRTAPTPAGPWTESEDVFTPPESRAPRPFVYAAKAHAEVDVGADGLLVTYAANSFDFADLFTDQGQRELYWPRAVRLSFRRQ